MACTDDFQGLTRAEQIVLVQAVAHEYGDQLTDAEAAQALSLYATQITDDMETPHAVLARRRYEIGARIPGYARAAGRAGRVRA